MATPRFSILTVAVFVVDTDQKVTFRNGAATQLFGTGTLGNRLANFVPNKRCVKTVDEVIEGRARASTSVRVWCSRRRSASACCPSS